MTIAVNPGSDPVDDATVANAKTNTEAFVADLNLPNVHVTRQPSNDHEGRFGFNLHLSNVTVEIDMPGLPLKQVRYLGVDAGHNPWHFPRLYVDGSSWLWAFALDVARDTLTAA